MRSREHEFTIGLFAVGITCCLLMPAMGQAAPDEIDAASAAFNLRMEAKYDEARQVLDQEVEKSPENGRAWFELARLRFHTALERNELDSSQEAIEKAIAASPDTGLYHCCAARIAAFNGILKAHAKDNEAMGEQMKKAIEAAEKAVALDPDDHAARRILTSLYGNNPPEFHGDKELAEKHIGILEERSPIDGASARGEFSCRGNQEGRLNLWKELIEELGADSRLHENLALEYGRAGNLEEAEKHAARALELNPKDGKILMNLARTFALDQKFDPAEDFAQRYLAHEPPGPLAYRAWTTSVLARIQKMKGDNESAEKTLKEAKEMDARLWLAMSPPPEELFDAP